nr:MAG TPA: hypothetical protein [Microviridae sp.]
MLCPTVIKLFVDVGFRAVRRLIRGRVRKSFSVAFFFIYGDKAFCGCWF